MRLGRFLGIDLVLHWTFGLAPLYFLLVGLSDRQTLGQIAWMELVLAMVFLFVGLHEYGHALTARWFGIGTKEIILTPIGGVALLKSLPEDPSKEILIAFAGPAVNVVLAGMLFGGLSLANVFGWNLGLQMSQFLQTLILVNLLLFAFNLIPSFPMDGGRIFRATLAYFMPYERATGIAVSVAKVFAIAFIIYGLINFDFGIAFIGLFVFAASSAEWNRLLHVRRQHSQMHSQSDWRSGEQPTERLGAVVEGHVKATRLEITENSNQHE